MRAEVIAVMRDLFPGEPDAKLAARQTVAQIMSHRLRKFGFEPQINAYTTPELKLLAFHLPDYQRARVLEEVERRGD